MSERISKSEKGNMREFLSYSRLFFHLAGFKFIALPVFIIGVGLFENIGIVLFFPLLEELTSGDQAEASGILGAISTLLNWLHLNSFVGVLLFIVAVFLMKFAAVFGQSVAVAKIARDLYRSLADRLIRGISGADYARVYLKTTTGYFANAMTRELQVFIAAFSHYAGIFANIMFIVMYLIFSFLLDARMTLIAVIAGLVLFILLRSLTWMSRREGIALTAAAGQYQERAVEFMQYYKYLKATGRLARIEARLKDVVARLTQSRFRLSVIGGFISAIPEPIAVLLVAGFLYVYVMVWENSFTLIAVLLLLFYRTVMRMMTLQSDWNGFFAASGALKVIPETLAAVEQEKESYGEGEVHRLEKGVALDKIQFSYRDRTVLKDISMRISKQTTVALVGISGAGKSTLVDILTGVLKPVSGTVTYDGVSYADLDVETLRRRTGYVTQEITIFNDSILNNVSFWDPTPKEEVNVRVERACLMAQCKEFIEKLPQKYDTPVGDRGINLSVGQRQRISIARELYRDPEILIFDEATSALDSESEQAIQKSIEALKGSKTMILIAHRLSTIKNADRIYVIDQGRVAEQGTFQELYENPSSAFRRMCDLQSFG